MACLLGTGGLAAHCRRMELTLKLAPYLALTCVLWSRASAEVTISFEGIGEELQGAVRAHLELAQYTDREISRRQANRLFADADAQIQQALQPYGYYHA